MAFTYHKEIVKKSEELYRQGVPPVFERDLPFGFVWEPARGNLVGAVGTRRAGRPIVSTRGRIASLQRTMNSVRSLASASTTSA